MIQSRLVKITDPRLVKPGCELFTTLEGENPGLSIKDHMVCGELQELESKGFLRERTIISEVSAGSTALSLATWCPRYKTECVLFVPTGTDPTKLELLKEKGARLQLHPKESIYDEHDQFQLTTGSYSFNQLFDPHKSRHYLALGKRIRDDIGFNVGVLGAVGTGHSLKGLAMGLGSHDIFTAEPASDVKIPGIRNLDLEKYGDKDPCLPDFFSGRFFANSSDLFPHATLLSNEGPLHIGKSFQLTLGVYLKHSHLLPKRLFLLSADSRRC